MQYYLRGLANGRLAEMPLDQALAEPIRLSEMGTAGPLVDMVKLDDICADYIATLSGEQILAEVITWACRYDPDLVPVLEAERPLALRALAIERDSTDNPRKDLRKWADFRAVYGYFFPELFDMVTDPADARFGGLDPDLVRAVADAFARRLPAARGRTPTGSARSASSRRTSGSRPARRSTSRTRRPTRARSGKRPRSSGSCSPGPRAAPTWPPWPPRSAPMRCSAGSARCGNVPGTIRAYRGVREAPQPDAGARLGAGRRRRVHVLAAMVLLGLNAASGLGPDVCRRVLAVAVLAYTGAGRLITSRLPGNAVGWLLGLIGVSVAAATFAEQYTLYGLATARGSVPAARQIGTLAGAVAALTVVLLVFLILLFPDGRLPSRRWRPVAWAMLVVAAAGPRRDFRPEPESAAGSPTR